jgi:outer membrane receptor protein involved in Fe transport
VSLRLLVSLILAGLPLWAAGVTLNGRVLDENDAPVRGALVTADSQSAVTDPDGIFHLRLPGPGQVLVSVDCEGYYALKNQAVIAENPREVTLVINSVREVFQSENVTAETSPVDLDQPQNQERLSGTEINELPYANSHSLRSALILMPGVLEDAAGAVHVNGASENQVLYNLNGFNVANPISGQFRSALAVEGIRELELSSGSYSPQFGKGSAGVLNIGTENGTDAFHYTATDFIPGVSLRQGLRLGNWYPRLGVSGPIVKGRAWFSDTFDSEYSQSLVTGLPSGQNTRTGWLGSNLLHTQVNLTPSNILYADFLVNIDNEGRVGLGPLNPIPTTSSVHARQYFASLKDQVYLGRGTLVEFGYAHNYFSEAQTPQGTGLYVISSTGYSGNYFVDDTQNATRDQALVHVWLPKFKFAGSHQIEVGADADWLVYNGDFHRTGYELLERSGQLYSETLYPTPALFRVNDTEMSAYALDTWRVSKRLQFTAGVREDWDRKIAAVAWSPRAAFTWSPFASGHTRISGGYSLVHDALTLETLGLPLDQTAYTTDYNAKGNPVGPPLPTIFTIGNTPLFLPRSSNWNAAVDQQLAAKVFLTARYLRRRATDGFAFINTLAPDAPPSLLPLPGTNSAGIYQLTNLRRDDYDSVQVSVRQKFSGQYEWMASYTRSRAVSNAVLDPDAPQPLQVIPGMAPMPWDAPNRLLAFAYFPLPRHHWFTKDWAISVLADMRSGFPFSVRGQTGIISGAVDSYRYPLNFDLNIAIERMVTLRGYRFAVRGGVDNATNQANPTAVDNVVGAAQYLQFYGLEGRHYVARIRFFGKAR